MSDSMQEEYKSIRKSLEDYIEFYEESHSHKMDVAFLRKVKLFLTKQQVTMLQAQNDLLDMEDKLLEEKSRELGKRVVP